MTDCITHARDAMFDRKTCLINDPCFFRVSPMHHEQHGTIKGKSLINPRIDTATRFDVLGDDGKLHQNVTDVRLDHEGLGNGSAGKSS